MIILLKLIERVIKLISVFFIIILNAFYNNYVLIALLKLKLEFKKKRCYFI